MTWISTWSMEVCIIVFSIGMTWGRLSGQRWVLYDMWECYGLSKNSQKLWPGYLPVQRGSIAVYSPLVWLHVASKAYAGYSATSWIVKGHPRTVKSYDLEVYLINGGLYQCILHRYDFRYSQWSTFGTLLYVEVLWVIQELQEVMILRSIWSTKVYISVLSIRIVSSSLSDLRSVHCYMFKFFRSSKNFRKLWPGGALKISVCHTQVLANTKIRVRVRFFVGNMIKLSNNAISEWPVS